MTHQKRFQVNTTKIFPDGSRHTQTLFGTDDEAEWTAFRERIREIRPVMRGNMVGHPSVSKPVIVFRDSDPKGTLSRAITFRKLNRAPLPNQEFESVTALAEFMGVRVTTLLQAFARAKRKSTTADRILWHGLDIRYKNSASNETTQET